MQVFCCIEEPFFTSQVHRDGGFLLSEPFLDLFLHGGGERGRSAAAGPFSSDFHFTAERVAGGRGLVLQGLGDCGIEGLVSFAEDVGAGASQNFAWPGRGLGYDLWARSGKTSAGQSRQVRKEATVT
jgi:hypothetical protein